MEENDTSVGVILLWGGDSLYRIFPFGERLVHSNFLGKKVPHGENYSTTPYLIADSVFASKTNGALLYVEPPSLSPGQVVISPPLNPFIVTRSCRIVHLPNRFKGLV